ncbi:MAG: hypothetical protein RIR11_3645, partial [Bacteroidota bacterium]
MRSILKFSLGIWMVILAVFSASPVAAQDDLYYDPSAPRPKVTKSTTTTTTTTTETYTDEYDNTGSVTSVANDDGYYDDEDEYAYEYSSRIRRFHNRRNVVVDYYDPFFIDMYQYDPFYLPGSSIYVSGFDDYWSYRRWRRFNRINAGFGWGNPYA